MSTVNADSGQITYKELLNAYYSCRSRKRNTASALEFELDYEQNLLELQRVIRSGHYRPQPSLAFIVHRPVKREIFAASFRDRVVHHLLASKLNPHFERCFIYDSYACREDRGALFGIRRLDRFIRRCSQNYTRDAYVLKLDVQGFFMHIDKEILWKHLEPFVVKSYQGDDKQLVLQLLKTIIFDDIKQNCRIRGRRQEWVGLPKNKSLFFAGKNKGLPIGNLTSQVLANFYMNHVDHFIKHDLGVAYYGRYVDDMVLVHHDRAHLESLVPVIGHFLQSELGLHVHPNKIFLQHYRRGIPFLGAFIKPGRIYSDTRLKKNFYAAMQTHNQAVNGSAPSQEDLRAFVSSMNSYLGIMRHYQTYTLRNMMIARNLHYDWWKYMTIDNSATVFKTRPRRTPLFLPALSVR